MINFNEQEYRSQVLGDDPNQRAAAVDSLELAISRAPIEQAIKLKRLRTPTTIGRLESKALRDAGFDMEKQSIHEGYYDWMVLVWHAMHKCVENHWPELNGRYSDIEQFPINGRAEV